MREGIEAQLIGDFRKGQFSANEDFRFVDFQFEIGLINAHARLLSEKRAQIGFAVVQGVA